MIRVILLACVIYAVEFPAFSQNGQGLAGRTVDSLPYLKYSQGEERLGGAKMTYLDTGILVRVVDSIPDFYLVQLSKQHSAWLPKLNFRKDSLHRFMPFYLSGDWKVFGDEKFDYVSILLSEKLPYRSIQQLNPSRIVVDLFGVASNTNWINQLSSATEIKNAYYEQIGDDVMRVIIDLVHDQHWGHRIYYEGNKLVIRVSRQPADLSLSKLKVAIDAGHGGDNIGARGVVTGIKEKDYTLRIAKELEKAFTEEGATVIMTRTIDTMLTMKARTLMLREAMPDLLISIHFNSSDLRADKGVSTYYRYIGFRPLTQAVLKRMLELGLPEYGNVGSFNFTLSGPTEYPSCLLEVAFLSNPDEEKRIRYTEFHRQVASKVVAGVRDWLESLKP